MKLEDLQLLVKNITYKPGYSIELIYREHIFRWQLVIKYDCEDSKGLAMTAPDITFTINFVTQLQDELVEALDPERAKDWIYNCIIEAEIHEAEEWLKFDGKQFRFPHGN